MNESDNPPTPIIKSPIAVAWCQYQLKDTEHCTVAVKQTKTGGDMLVVESKDGRVKVALDANMPIKVLIQHFDMVNQALYQI